MKLLRNRAQPLALAAFRCALLFVHQHASAQFAQPEPANCRNGQLYIRESDLRGNLHITAFTFVLERGSFVGISRFPSDWDLHVQQAANGWVGIEARAHSTRSLNARLFSDIAVYVQNVCDEQHRLAVHGEILDTDRQGRTRSLPFSAFSFELSETPVRRKLPVH